MEIRQASGFLKSRGTWLKLVKLNDGSWEQDIGQYNKEITTIQKRERYNRRRG